MQPDQQSLPYVGGAGIGMQPDQPSFVDIGSNPMQQGGIEMQPDQPNLQDLGPDPMSGFLDFDQLAEIGRAIDPPFYDNM